MSTEDVAVRTHTRVGHGIRRPANWYQLVRFALVGGSGYVVNLAVFTALVHLIGVDYRLSAVGAFCVAVANNFVWNRVWTFRVRGGGAGWQAARFFAVSVAAFGVNLGILELLVAGAGLPEVPAQATAIVCATPIGFLGHKLWTFDR